MVIAELQTSLWYHVYFLWEVTFIFLSGFCVKNINKSQDSRERERLFFWLLSATFTRFSNCSVFIVCSYWRGLMVNEHVPSRSGNHTTFFYIKVPIRVNKGAGFLILLLNISFQPLIVAVNHSIIKLDVIEVLDPPQVFTC